MDTNTNTVDTISPEMAAVHAALADGEANAIFVQTPEQLGDERVASGDVDASFAGSGTGTATEASESETDSVLWDDIVASDDTSRTLN